MDTITATPSRRRSRRLVPFILLAIAGMVAAWIAYGIGEAINFQAMAETVEQDPDTGPIFVALRENFPDDYQTLVERLDDATGGSPMTDGTRAALRRSVQMILRSKLPAFTEAPDGLLVDWAQKQAVLIRILREEDVEACARYVRSDWNPNVRLSPRANGAAIQVVVAYLRAASAGERTPAERGRIDLSDSEKTQFGEELQAQDFSEDESGNSTVQCTDGLAVFNAITMLPLPTAAKLTALAARQLMAGPPTNS